MTTQQHDGVLLVLGAILIAIVGIADFYLPPSFVIAFGHAGVVLLGLLAHQGMVALALATLGTVAAFATWFLDAVARYDASTIANLGFVVALIWIVAALVHLLGRVGRHPRAQNWQPGQDESFYRALFNRTFQFVAALDVDGNVIEANQTLRDYAGLTANEIESMAIWMLPIFQNDEDVQERLKDKVRMAAEGEFSRDEFVVSGIGDQSTVIDLSLKPIPQHDGAIGQIIMEARDITEARTQQEMLVQAQKMEAVGELTAGVAHDFNNLLTVIVGNLELLEKRCSGDERLLDRLRRAIQAAFQGQSLTQQLLAFSRRQRLSPAVIDVDTSLEAMSKIYDALGDDITVELDLAGNLPHCEADPSALEVALLNIAINARDAMPDGGTLSFSTETVVLDNDYRGEVADLPPDRYVRLTVSDTGEGMPEDVVSHAFDPFFTTKPEGQGTGLGLSMVYGFVRQSGGDVKIYSELGKGTSIRIYLPTTDKPLPESEERPSGSGENTVAGNVSILVVEDDESVRETILDALKETGYELDVAENGDHAIKLINGGNRYDLLLTDVVMEGEAGGSEVARAARAAMPTIAVIFCSGFPRQNLQGEDAGIEGSIFLPKPFHAEKLIETVEKALARARNRQADASA